MNGIPWYILLTGNHGWEGAGVFDTTQALRVAVRACSTAERRKDWGRVVTWAERGLPLAGPDREAEGRLRFGLATALMRIGDLLRAEQEFCQFCCLADGCDCPALTLRVGDALHSLAQIHRLRSDEERAGILFHQACAAFASSGKPGQAARCRLEIAWGQLVAGQGEGALQHLATVRATLGALADPALAIDLAIAMARWHSLDGNQAEADRIGWAVLENKLLEDRQRAEVAWVLACNAMARGDSGAAAEFLETAHTAAVTDWSPPQMDRIHRLRLRLNA